MVDFVGALQAAGSGLTVLKELSQINKAYDEGLLKLKVAELSGALATVQIALAEAQAEVSRKDAQVAKLLSNFKQKQELVEYDGYFYRRGADGKPRGRPYCPRCMDKGFVMMTVRTDKSGRPEQCPECKHDYFGVSTFPFE